MFLNSLEMKINSKPQSFSDLRYNLEVCDELFLQHQLQLMHHNIEQALVFFEKLVMVRQLHLEIMEKLLLPAFIKITDKIPAGARPLYFEREKKQILNFLDKYARKLGKIILHSAELNIVTLFEEYAWLKDLLDHHDAREKAFLFPGLDKKLEIQAKKKILQSITAKLSILED
jgi:hypothetical protein